MRGVKLGIAQVCHGKRSGLARMKADDGNFKPFRRKIHYLKSHNAPIRPPLDTLNFMAGKTNWGYSFRYGLLEITKKDFETIAAAMNVKHESIYPKHRV